MDEFDYVIVGAGSAGCVIATRLSEDLSISICVLEAGSELHRRTRICNSLHSASDDMLIWDNRVA